MNLQIKDDTAFKSVIYSSAKQQDYIDKDLTAQRDPPALSLDERGLILECSKSLEMLFGFKESDLAYRHFSILFPQLADVELIQSGRVNPLLNYLCRCGHLFLAHNRQGESFTSNLCISHIGYDGSRFLRMLVRPSGMPGM